METKRQLEDDIMEFTGRYHFLSNFYEYEFEYNGVIYANAEAAFQCQKNPKELIQQYHMAPPNIAKRAGRKCVLREDWNDVRDRIMEEIIRAKFSNKFLAVKLAATNKAENLVEGNDWGDTYWGVDKTTGIGQNKLGKILMKVREDIIKSNDWDHIYKIKGH